MSSSKTSEQLETEKQNVAKTALRYVRPRMLLGLGSGSTANYFLDFLAEAVRRREITVQAVASSLSTASRARELGIPICEPRRGMRVDLTVDGADEISPDLNLIKGAGGALLREKVLARASRNFLVIADSSKRVPRLGGRSVPVEVTPFATPWIMDELAELGGNPDWRMRASTPDEPFLTDQQNHIIDCKFGLMDDARSLAANIKALPGVVEHGLFLGLAHAALLADGPEIVLLRPHHQPMPLSQAGLVLE